MESISSAERSLEERLEEYPELKAKIEAMLAIMENAGGDIKQAAEAEPRIIEEMRPMGHEGLQSWARRQQQKKEDELIAATRTLTSGTRSPPALLTICPLRHRTRLPTLRWAGWSLDTFVLARSAPPDNLMGAIIFAGGTALYPHPNVVPGVPLELYGAQYPGGKIFNSAAFSEPPTGQQGNFGRNVLRGLELHKRILRCSGNFKTVGLRFRAEFFQPP
jgi:hypothetical protein